LRVHHFSPPPRSHSSKSSIPNDVKAFLFVSPIVPVITFETGCHSTAVTGEGLDELRLRNSVLSSKKRAGALGIIVRLSLVHRVPRVWPNGVSKTSKNFYVVALVVHGSTQRRIVRSNSHAVVAWFFRTWRFSAETIGRSTCLEEIEIVFDGRPRTSRATPSNGAVRFRSFGDGDFGASPAATVCVSKPPVEIVRAEPTHSVSETISRTAVGRDVIAVWFVFRRGGATVDGRVSVSGRTAAAAIRSRYRLGDDSCDSQTTHNILPETKHESSVSL